VVEVVEVSFLFYPIYRLRSSDIIRRVFFGVFVFVFVSGVKTDNGGLGGGVCRYSAFVVLYPVGFLSEASLVYLGLVGARDISLFYRGYLFLGLLAYIPGKLLPLNKRSLSCKSRCDEADRTVASYILYTYMLSQRRRALKRPQEKA
jgi:hypothetical protein